MLESGFVSTLRQIGEASEAELDAIATFADTFSVTGEIVHVFGAEGVRIKASNRDEYVRRVLHMRLHEFDAVRSWCGRASGRSSPLRPWP